MTGRLRFRAVRLASGKEVPFALGDSPSCGNHAITHGSKASIQGVVPPAVWGILGFFRPESNLRRGIPEEEKLNRAGVCFSPVGALRAACVVCTSRASASDAPTTGNQLVGLMTDLSLALDKQGGLLGAGCRCVLRGGLRLRCARPLDPSNLNGSCRRRKQQAPQLRRHEVHGASSAGVRSVGPLPT